MSTKRTPQTGLNALIEGDEVRRVERGGRTLYAAVDVVAVLSGSQHSAEYWADLKLREPALANLVEPAEFTGADGVAETAEALTFQSMLRLVQSIPSARAERLKVWLAQTARERLEEHENPELAVLRTRRLYEQKGYSRQWVDKRLRGISARHELTGEWYKRGATESDQYRALTNEIMRGAFGMDVEAYRQYKNLYKTGQNLRDHMTDLELALTSLGETVAVALHKDRQSQGFEALVADAKDAGEIVARTRSEIEARSGRPVVQSGNQRGWWMGRRNSAPRPRPARSVDVNGATLTGRDTPVDVGQTSPEAPATRQTADRDAAASDKAVA